MHINRITPQVTFGYNKKVNDQLRLCILNDESHNKEAVEELKTLHMLSLESEINLRKTEEAKMPDSDCLYAYALFASVKKNLAEKVEKFYPELEFTKVEASTYFREDFTLMGKKGYDFDKETWQIKIASDLQAVAKELDKKTKNSSPISEKKIEPKQIKPQEQVEDDDDENEKIDLNKIPSVIEKFTPTFSSPKGFKSIGGMEDLKIELYDKIINPANNPEEAELDFIEYGKRQPRGIMFYGPPGCGKTMTAEAVSAEAHLPLFKLKISKAGSQYINETSKNYQKAFDYVEEYSKHLGTPCIMLIDEVDGLTKGRDGKSSGEDLKQMSTLLNLIESARDKNIIVIGTTNKYDIVDEAIRRRFDEQIYLGMPDKETRGVILKNTLAQWTKGLALSQNAEEIEEIAQKTKGFPSSAIVILTDKASNRARKDGRREIRKEDFIEEIAQNQNLKVKEEQYKNNTERKSIGFVQ